MNYRKIYAEHFGMRCIPRGYVIHHIDRDRENNDISNLLMIPSSLHARYHFILNLVESVDLRSIVSLSSDSTEYTLMQTKHIFPVMMEIRKWIAFKEYLHNRNMSSSLPDCANEIIENYVL